MAPALPLQPHTQLLSHLSLLNCVYIWVKTIWKVKFKKKKKSCCLIPAGDKNRDWSLLTWPVSRDPYSTLQIYRTPANSIFSCSAGVTPARQAGFTSSMCECVWGGIFSFFFYTRSVRSKRASGPGGSQEWAYYVQRRTWVMCEASSAAVIRSSLGCALAD